MEWKRSLHRQHETTLVETYSYEMKEGTLTDLLYSKLEKHGVNFKPLSFQELIKLLADIGEEQKATRFTRLITTFLDLFKQSGRSLEEVRTQSQPERLSFLYSSKQPIAVPAITSG
jgi:DNA helicase IV